MLNGFERVQPVKFEKIKNAKINKELAGAVKKVDSKLF